jgi:hypothetical protein
MGQRRTSKDLRFAVLLRLLLVIPDTGRRLPTLKFQEHCMKTSMIVIAFAAFTTAGLAHASDATPTSEQQSGVVQTGQLSPGDYQVARKTRSQVRSELKQSETDGQLMSLNNEVYKGN